MLASGKGEQGWGSLAHILANHNSTCLYEALFPIEVTLPSLACSSGPLRNVGTPRLTRCLRAWGHGDMCVLLSQCTASCGGGVQTRSVQCLVGGRPASGCLLHQKPLASLACNTHFCPIAEKKGECLGPLSMAWAWGWNVRFLEQFLGGPGVRVLRLTYLFCLCIFSSSTMKWSIELTLLPLMTPQDNIDGHDICMTSFLYQCCSLYLKNQS